MRVSPRYCALGTRGRRAGRENFGWSAFTLIEMLIVIAIIAVLSALTLPALQGLLGTSGVRGGVNTVLATLDQARAAAIENGTDVYVGFPPSTFTDPADPNTRFAAMIVIRGARFDETPGTFRPLSRWVRLPSGVVQTNNMSLAALTGATNLPRLANSDVAPVFLRYDRFGRIRTPGSNIAVGEGLVNGSAVQWKGNNRETLTAQRLTGRWTATRP
jgi:prepilin-type N-terminal cleavage/methylation domain-containing protein